MKCWRRQSPGSTRRDTSSADGSARPSRIQAVPRRRYTLADVRRSYTPEKRWSELEGDLPSFLLYRPISLVLTPPALWLRLSPVAVTTLGLAVSLALPVAAAIGGPLAYVWVAALALVNHVLDCLDGNIARTTGRSSRAGALYDGFCDIVFWTLYFLAIGILTHRLGAGLVAGRAVEVSLGLALLVLLHRQLRDSYALEFGTRAEWSSSPPPALSPVAWAKIAVIALERFYAFALLVGGIAGRLEVVLTCIASYVVLIFAGAVWLTFTAARAAQPTR